MASQPMIIVGAIAAAAITLVVIWMTGSWGTTGSWIIANGKSILTTAQVIGIFYCGMAGRLRLGAILIFTTLATVLWGW